MIKIKLPENVKGNFLTNVSSQSSKEIGKTLGNLFYFVFNPINFPIEKFRIKKSLELEEFERLIIKEVSSIPEDDLKEPDISIIGPALEASKYYIGDFEMRRLFSKLISASLNKKEESKVHHSFVEVIKQLSPLDAIVLRQLYEAGCEEYSYILVMSPLYGNGDNYENEVVLDNLNRLGLIKEIGKDIEVKYEPPYREGYFENPGEVYIDDHGEDRYTTVITAYGKNFCRVCI